MNKNIYTCCLIGSTNVLIDCAEYLIAEQWIVMCVISTDINVIKWAKEQNIKYYTSLEYLEQYDQKLDYLFSIVNEGIIPSNVVRLAKKHVVNYHYSLLPKYAGLNSTTWAILNGEQEHGITWHIVNNGIDKGDILEQASIPIEENETTLSLNLKCAQLAVELFKCLIYKIGFNQIKRTKQNLLDRSYYSSTHLPKNYGFINWNVKAKEIDQLCRALFFGQYPNPITLPKIMFARQVYLLNTYEITKKKSVLSPGFLSCTQSIISVATKDYDIHIIEIKSLQGDVLDPHTVLDVNEHNLSLNISYKSLKELRHIKDIRKQDQFCLKQLYQYIPYKLPVLLDKTAAYVSNVVILDAKKVGMLASNLKINIDRLIIALILIYLYKINGGESYSVDIKRHNPHLSTIMWVSTSIPFHVELQKHNILDDIFISLNTILANDSLCFNKDIYFRYNDLKRIDNNNKICFFLQNDSSCSAINEIYNEEYAISILLTKHNKVEIFYKQSQQNEVFMQALQAGIIDLLDGLHKNPLLPIGNLPILSQKRYEQTIETWNETKQHHFQEKTIHQLFEEQVEKTPNNVAVVFEEDQLTYSQLNKKANQSAHFIRYKYNKVTKHELRADTLIGLYTERNLETIIGMLAILKSGGAYVPLDPEYPQDRLAFIIQDTKIPLILTQEHSVANLSNFIDENRLITYKQTRQCSNIANKNANPSPISHFNNLAYTIYTSGSTGKPKGVLLEHRTIVNLIGWQISLGKLIRTQKITQLANMTFDVSLQEIFYTLLNGYELHLISANMKQSISQFINYILKHKINIIFMPPNLLEYFSYEATNIDSNKNGFTSLAEIIVAGDTLKITPSIYKFLKKNDNLTLINHYGPSETHVVTSFRLSHNKKFYLNNKPPIGKSISNVNVYVLNHELQHIPVGISGELYIGGECLARGYLNRPKLTEEQFIKNPFISESEKTQKKNLRLYKTGDLVRWLPDGNLEFLGRIDNQVKIRGFRIELGEIEAVLTKHKNISQSVVIVRDDSKQKTIVAYYVLNKENKNKISAKRLSESLAKQLPKYMIPSYFIELESIPLTTNGKVDRKALPKPNIDNINLGNEFVAPRTEQEQILAKIWCEILGLERVGIYDDFFSLGGHSLNVMQVSLRITEDLKINCPVQSIFEYKTIANLAKHLQTKRTNCRTQQNAMVLVDRKINIPLSFSQKRLWFLDQYTIQQSISYNLPIAIQLIGKLDLAALEESFNILIQRHEILRTIFKEKNGELWQTICAKNIFQLKSEEIRQVSLETLLSQEASKPFYLSTLPLIRIKVFSINQNHVLMITQHHIISDGWSIRILIKELSALYNSIITKQEPILPNLEFQYTDFVYWQNKWLNDITLAPHIKYWKNKLQNLTKLNLPTDLLRPMIKTYNGKKYQFQLKQDLANALELYKNQEKLTLFMLLLSAFKVLLHHYSKQEDIIVGSPVANRHNREIESMLGCFVNTIALRSDLSGNPTFTEVCARIKQTCLEAYAHQDLPFELLVKELDISRDPTFDPIFQVMFVLNDNIDNTNWGLSGIRAKTIEIDNYTSKFDLTFYVYRTDNNLACSIEYNTDLYKNETIVNMAQNFITILEKVIKDSSKPIASHDLLTLRDKQKILLEWNQTTTTYPRTKTIHQLFEEQVEKTPNNVAAIARGETITYASLNSKANQLGCYLREKHTNRQSGANPLIGICVERGLEMLIGILGILKSGGAYVPLDPEYPKNRLGFIIQDTKISLLLTQKQILKQHPFLSSNVTHKMTTICLNSRDVLNAMQTYSSHNISAISKPNDLAYVIYTSGSTGKPKGVMVEHLPVINTINWVNTRFQINVKDCLLFVTSLCFDLSVYDIFGVLSAGGRIRIALSEEIKDPNKLSKILANEPISFWDSTPATLEYLIPLLQKMETTKNMQQLRLVFLSGDWIPVNLPNKLRSLFPKVKIVSLGGATEAAIWSNYYLVKNTNVHWKSIPYGRPINNATYLVLNSSFLLSPVGIPGELYIGGECLARGYLNRPELTKERFIKNPFISESEKTQKKNLRLYKTGDLVRWLPDGNLEFLGRIDNQVKIRGFRIELGEIEAVLTKHKNISQSVVIVRDDSKQKTIVAYYVLNKENKNKISAKRLSESLAKQLPKYMIPSYFIELESIPLTTNGKVDRKALPKPNIDNINLGNEFVAPRTEQEQILAKIWCEVLGLERVGIYDDFFSLGGHSLLAIQMINKINMAFNGNLPIAWIFQYPIIEQQSFHMLEQSIMGYKPILHYNVDGDLPSLFFIHPGLGGAEVYHDFSKIFQRRRPIYCIESYNIYSDHIIDSLEELARKYIQEIKCIQSSGPYSLGGWSLGGVIAYEMARQLEQEGESVPAIYMLDSFSLLKEKFINACFNSSDLKIIQKHTEQYLAITHSFRRKLELVYHAEKKMCDTYSYPHYNGKTILFKATNFEKARKYRQKLITKLSPSGKELCKQLLKYSPWEKPYQYNGWESVIPNLQVIEIFTDHLNIIKKPYAQSIVRIIENDLPDYFQQ